MVAGIYFLPRPAAAHLREAARSASAQGPALADLPGVSAVLVRVPRRAHRDGGHHRRRDRLLQRLPPGGLAARLRRRPRSRRRRARARSAARRPRPHPRLPALAGDARPGRHRAWAASRRSSASRRTCSSARPSAGASPSSSCASRRSRSRCSSSRCCSCCCSRRLRWFGYGAELPDRCARCSSAGTAGRRPRTPRAAPGSSRRRHRGAARARARVPRRRGRARRPRGHRRRDGLHRRHERARDRQCLLGIARRSPRCS